MTSPTRIAVVGSASGSGKTTLARRLAAHLDAAFVEFDSLQHGPNWTFTPDEELRRRIAPIVAGARWVIDALAERKLGPLVVDAVELIVWLDLPPQVWLPRLIRRSARRWFFREELCNGNRETLHGILLEKDGVLPHALRAYFRRRGALGARLHELAWRDGKRLVRLCSTAEVDAFVAAFARP